MVGMLDTKTLKGYLNRLKASGLAVYHDSKAGTAEAKDGETVVLKGIQKGKGGPWIVRYANSEQVKWGFEVEPSAPVRVV